MPPFAQEVFLQVRSSKRENLSVSQKDSLPATPDGPRPTPPASEAVGNVGRLG